MAKRKTSSLDRRITIQRAASVPNEFNEMIKTWSDLMTVRASRRDVSDTEKISAGQIGAAVMTRFVIRSSAQSRAITPSDRIVHDGKTWSIHGIKEVGEGRRRFLEISAVADID